MVRCAVSSTSPLSVDGLKMFKLRKLFITNDNTSLRERIVKYVSLIEIKSV